MLIALLSDTHDDARATRAALDLLAPYRPQAYLHAGDLVEAPMLDLFSGLPAGTFHYVFGNNEVDLPAIWARAEQFRLLCHDRIATLELGGKRIAMTHGHEANTLHQLVFSRGFDYVIHGHTHVRRDERHNGTRIINPGAVHRARVRSVALLDLATDELRFLDVPTS